MKLYNHISTWAFAGLLAFTGCSQEESLEGSSSLQGFQISVTDAGFQNLSEGRATDENFKTTFVKGDAIGVYAVENGQVVEGVANRKFTMNEKGEWDLEGNPIEYDSERFKNITFYAYYPYQADEESIQFDAAAEDPFASLVSNWQIAADQGGTKYTQSDLMTSSSKAEDGRLQGKVSFTMLHEMALAVLKIPNLVYDFTNGGLDDYSLNVAPKELLINDVKTTPYYDAASGTYMALVKPETNYSISGTYQGAKEMAFSAAGSLASGKAKMYIINDNDANKLDYTLQIGDYLCADGNLVSVDAATVPDNAIGVVCYVGNPQPHVYAPDACSETQDALYRDYPNCSHGLVLSLNNAVLPDGTATSRYHTSKSGTYDTWFDSDEEWAGKFVYCNSNRDGNLKNDALTMFPAFFGYNNTVLMTMVTEEGKGSPSTCDNAYSFIVAYRNAVAVPSAATPWYIPSIKDWQQVADNLTNINKSIIKVGGEEMTSVDNGALTGHYWSSTQRNDTFQWTHGMDGGAYNLICERGSRAGQFRMMLAF